MTKKLVVGLIALMLALPSSAFAVLFTEAGDAPGDLPGQALGLINGHNTIQGHLLFPAFKSHDEDIYEFSITTIGPPRPVYISTFPGTAPWPAGTLDTMLQLFNSSGKGIVGNDDIVTAANTDSYLTAMLPAGTYYLAISAFDYAPEDVSNHNIFPGMSGSGLALADPSAGPLDHYSQIADQGLTQGPYSIDVIVPEPGTLLLLAAGLLGLAGWTRTRRE